MHRFVLTVPTWPVRARVARLSCTWRAAPARGITGHFARVLPRGLPTDRLRGLLDRVPDPRGPLVLALVAVHAVTVEELRRLRLVGYDAVWCALTVRRTAGPFTITLGALVAEFMTTWLLSRATLRPHTTNPAPPQPPHRPQPGHMSRYGLEGPFRAVGISAGRLRADRILDEADHTSDPVQLMRVFGIATATAVRYVHAAHTEHFTGQPTSA
ncbi:hypothetical protein [Saccharothrix sp.]|uniref:hypothetical protein n=1 Tax=Saccharothrix sp. TaxID=1873460 RepID=UPI002810A00B|nr:hypothetical protein [Saccharothrix sp.]